MGEVTESIWIQGEISRVRVKVSRGGGSLISLCGETIITNSQNYNLLPSELR